MWFNDAMDNLNFDILPVVANLGKSFNYKNMGNEINRILKQFVKLQHG